MSGAGPGGRRRSRVPEPGIQAFGPSRRPGDLLRMIRSIGSCLSDVPLLLREVSDDPVAELAAGRYKALVALELERLSLRSRR